MIFANQKKRLTNFVSFSGIDGAGKSTQIEALCSRLKVDDQRVLIIRFWDDIARLKRIRERAGHAIFGGDEGVGTIAVPINRRDKNVRSWLMTGLRLFLYFMDAFSVRLAVRRALRSNVDAVIFDRYIHDELANLPLLNPFIRAYVRLIMKIVPMPQISFFLDADPTKARARKPEYPVEFLFTNRQSYLALSDVVGGITIIAPMSIMEVEQAILMHARMKLSFNIPHRENIDGMAARVIGSEPAKVERPQNRLAAS